MGVFIIKGVEYNSLDEILANKELNKFNLSESVVKRNLQFGLPIEKALVVRRINKKLQLGDRCFTSVQEIVNDSNLNKHNLSANMINSRLRCGLSLEVALSYPKRVRLTSMRGYINPSARYTVFGKSFSSLTDLVLDESVNRLGLSRATIKKRLDEGMSLEEALKYRYTQGYNEDGALKRRGRKRKYNYVNLESAIKEDLKRDYDEKLLDLEEKFKITEKTKNDLVIGYCRANNFCDIGKLKSQYELLGSYFSLKGIDNFEIVQEVRDENNLSGKVFMRLINRVLNGEISKVVVFRENIISECNFEFIKMVCKNKGVEIEVLDK